MYLLALHLTGRRDAAFLAGLVFAFFPYHVSGNWDGQMNLANMQWLPLFVLFLLRTVERRRGRRRRAAGRALSGPVRPGLLVFPALCRACGAWSGWPTARWPSARQWSWRTVGLLLLAGAVGVALMRPLSPARARRDDRAQNVEAAVAYHAEDKASDLLAFFVPSSDHPLLGEWAAPGLRALPALAPGLPGLRRPAPGPLCGRRPLPALAALAAHGAALCRAGPGDHADRRAACPIPPCRRPTAC